MRATLTSSLSALLALGACGPVPGEQPAQTEIAQSRQAMADTSKEDVFAQAPYRVEGLDTVLPVDVVVSDARRAGIAIKTFFLNYVSVSVLRPAGWTEFYRRDFGHFDLAASGTTNGMFLLHVSEGLGAGLIDGKPVTARSLGATAGGDLVDLLVIVDTEGGKGNDQKWIRLRTRVAEAPLPHRTARFAGWYAGDTHVHTMYTNNWAEFGLPHRALLHAAHASGLDWISTADHSNDLDPTCDGRAGFFGDNVSTLVSEWTFCENGQAMPCTYRNHIGVANGFLMAEDDAQDAMTWASGWSQLRFNTGEEITLNSAAGKTVHALSFGAGYVEAKGSGATVQGVAIDCDPITMTIPTLLNLTPATGFVYAAHPTQPLKPGINGGAWADADFQTALASPRFAGFQFWNTRITGSTTAIKQPQEDGGLDPYAGGNWIGTPCDPTGAECHPSYLQTQAIPLWDTWLSRRCATGEPGPFGAAGSDSHGDFNFTTTTDEGLTVDIVDDNALARVRTVARAPFGEMSEILDALRQGRTVLTDGPMVTFGIDRTGDGTLGQSEDVQVGARVKAPAKGRVEFRIDWETTAEFGELGELRLVRGDSTTGNRPLTYQVFVDPEKLGGADECRTASRTSGSCPFVVSSKSSFGLPAAGKSVYFRLEASTKDGKYLALANPIWLDGVDCVDADEDGSYVGTACSEIPELAGKAADCDDTKALVAPTLSETCDDKLDNDCDGATDEDCDTGGSPEDGCGCGANGGPLAGLTLFAALAPLALRRRRQ